MAACNLAPDVGELELELSSSYKAQVRKGTLFVTGSAASSRLALRLGSTGLLEVDVGDDGSADFRFDRSTFDRIVIDAGGGDDIVRMDESNGAFTHEEQVTIIGGDGNDTLMGGVGAETFHGGRGDDTIYGGLGTDVIFMGEGNDTVVWYPGGGSDIVDGEDGSDTLVFNGAAVSESIDLSADEGRVRFVRDVAAVALDLDGIERIDVHVLAGADHVVVNDLTGTAVARVNVDLGATGDGQADVVTVNGAPDTIDVAAEGAAVVAGDVSVTNGEPTLDRLLVNGVDRVNVNGTAGADTMTVFNDGGIVAVQVAGWNVIVDAHGMGHLAVNGLGGDDTIRALSVTIPLRLDGGDGNDVITGGYGPDTIIGGPGDDVFIWNPGGNSDVLDGDDGSDTLVFNGANVSEAIDLSANGGRLRFARDVAAITLDAGGIERVDLNVLGGADRVVVNDLTGTSVARVNVDLGAAGDGQTDVVTVNSAQSIDVAPEGAAVVAGDVSVTNGEPTLDRLLVNGSDRLNVNGSAGADTMTIFNDGGIVAVQVAGWNVIVDAQGMGQLAVHGLGGDDTIQALSVTIPLLLDGGDGNDVITGGYGRDTLVGGPGDDVFVWNPGGNSDVVDGEDGADTLVFNGASASEGIDLSANGGRLRFVRDVAAVTLDAGGIERVDLRVQGGADTVVVNDLTGTAVAQVSVDVGDAQLDSVTINGSPAADAIAVFADAGAVVVSGLAAAVRITHPDLVDRLVVNGLGGVDTFTAGPGVDLLLWLTIDQN